MRLMDLFVAQNKNPEIWFYRIAGWNSTHRQSLDEPPRHRI